MVDNSGEECAICLSLGAPVREAGCTKTSTGGGTNQRVGVGGGVEAPGSEGAVRAADGRRRDRIRARRE